MRKLTILLCMLFFALASNAQTKPTLSELFQVKESQQPDAINFGSTQKKKGRLENLMYKEIRQVQFSDIAQKAVSDLPGNRGYFRFSIPASKRTKGTGNVLVSPVKIETMPSGDYT